MNRKSQSRTENNRQNNCRHVLHQYDRADAHAHGTAAQNQIHVINKVFFQFFSYNSAYDTANYNSERVDNYTNRHVSFLLIIFLERELFCPFIFVDFQETASDKVLFLIERNRAIENRLAGNSVNADRRIEGMVVGWVKHMAVAARNRDHIHIRLESCRHCPHYITHIEDIHILVYQEYML